MFTVSLCSQNMLKKKVNTEVKANRYFFLKMIKASINMVFIFHLFDFKLYPSKGIKSFSLFLSPIHEFMVENRSNVVIQNEIINTYVDSFDIID